MSRGTIHVVPHPGGWAVKRAGSTRATRVTYTKAEAIEVAKRYAYREGNDISVHGQDGQFQKTIRFENLSGDNCFLTTACVKYYKLDDECYQLKTLRKFRDTFLSNSKVGRRQIKQYYSVAPLIVSALENEEQPELTYQKIFLQINLACEQIERRQFTNAVKIYRSTVISLMSQFKIDF